MAWRNDRAAREHSNATYGSAEYRRNKPLVLQRDGRRCVICGSSREIEVDHIIPVSRGGSHQLDNLRVLCGECHRKKTATEGNHGGGRRRRRDPKPTSMIIYDDQADKPPY